MQHGYRTLMTRGMKGCYVYFTDGPLERYFRGRLGRSSISSKQLEKILRAAVYQPGRSALRPGAGVIAAASCSKVKGLISVRAAPRAGVSSSDTSPIAKITFSPGKRDLA